MVHDDRYIQGYLQFNESGASGPYPPDLHLLEITLQCLPIGAHLKIWHSRHARYTVQGIANPPDPLYFPQPCDSYDLDVESTSPFVVALYRKGTKELLWRMSPRLVFEDQYIEITTEVDKDAAIYGLGERVGPLKLSMNDTYTMYARDNCGSPEETNLYGSHPMWMTLLPSGNASGGFFLNSNAMSVTISPGSEAARATMTFKMIGGIVDLFLYAGPDPVSVIQQHAAVVGLPHLTPLWALGWHQCRWGYPDLAAVKEVVAQYRAAGIPLETMWTDIDYMDGYRDFTTDPAKFPAADVRAWLDEMHARGQKWVPIVDPGIKVDAAYAPFTDGAARGIFVYNRTGAPYVGKVWPGFTVWPDFTHPNASDYWHDHLKAFHDMVPFDGLWIDMNEPDSFCDGVHCGGGVVADWDTATGGMPFAPPPNVTRLPAPALPPPFLPGDQTRPLNWQALESDSLQYAGYHYDVHNMYGHTEGVATQAALRRIKPNEREFIISRSTFPGSGRYVSHWLGDNYARFSYLKYSIMGVINFQQFGIPFTGADICGFSENTTPELCTRWTEVGALQPFARNHNAVGFTPQEPYVFGEPYTPIMRKWIQFRYSLLLHYYSLLIRASRTGRPAFNALAFVFPRDARTHAIDEQFMVGEALLASPALHENQTEVRAYMPPDELWYDVWTGALLEVPADGLVTLAAPLDTMPLHIRGGYVVVRQAAAETVAATTDGPINLLAALDECGSATTGDVPLYVDDGVSLDSVEQSRFTTVAFSIANHTLSSTLLHRGYTPACSHVVGNVSVYGVWPPSPSTPRVRAVLVNGAPLAADAFLYEAAAGALRVALPALPLCEEFAVEWRFVEVPVAPAAFDPLWVAIPLIAVAALAAAVAVACWCRRRHIRAYQPIPDAMPAPAPDAMPAPAPAV